MCVLWPLKYAKMRWSLVGWGGDTPFHPFHTQPHSAPLAPRYENALPPRYFHLEPCTVHLFLGPNPSYCWGQDPEARMDRRSWVNSSASQRVAYDLCMWPTGAINSAEHDGPHSDELLLVDVSVVVDVEGADELSCFGLVAVECLADHVHQLVRTQHSISVCVQRVETPPNVLVTASRQSKVRSVCIVPYYKEPHL